MCGRKERKEGKEERKERKEGTLLIYIQGLGLLNYHTGM